MNSEKVKEIKEALQDHSIEKLKYQDGIKIKEIDFIDILTLINELESENEILKINMHETENLGFQINQMNGNLIIENQQLKAEIERLKEVIADQNELCWNCKKSVKEFAEKLKKRLNLGLYEWQYAEVDSKTIDELLKEDIDEG